jgi:PAS domain-containing protein
MNKPDPLPSDLDSLFVERERAQVTLDSIGDSVVSTDFPGHVTYLNKAAKHLTGFPQEAASGRPIGEVFRLVDAAPRRPVDCPVTESSISAECPSGNGDVHCSSDNGSSRSSTEGRTRFGSLAATALASYE